MKSPSSAPQRSSRSSSDRSSRSSSRGLVKVRCSFCGNTFYASPREAVCRKCNRPANRPMSPLVRAASLVLPPLGLVYSAIIRAHSPFASNQGLLFSIVGAVLYAGLFALKRLF